MATAAQPRPGPRLDRKEAFEHIWSQPTGLIGALRVVDNIPIAQRYLATGFMFFVLGGILALLMRVQLGSPDNTFLDPETYNQIFTMHGTTMMFLFVIPFIEALANYLLPLLLGTRDLPFPRLTALSYWTYLFGGLLLYSSFLFGLAPDGGWFAYVPLTNRQWSPGLNLDFWDIALSVAEIAAMGAAAEMIVAILRMRAPGMSISRIPVFGWAMLVTAFMIIFAFTPLIVGTAMLELDRKGFTSFFVPENGGDPLLWQHLFWVFGHPEVYIMFLPAVGIVTQIVQVFSRRPVVSYALVVLAIVATGFLSFGLWVHHMYTTGLSPLAMGYFAAASTVIAIPTGVQVVGWVATLWTGRPEWRSPLLFSLAGLVIFVVGGITGVMVASPPFDQQAHDSYFVVAHLHYVLIGGTIFPLFAGLYYWLPKITGRMMSERVGLWSAGIMFVGFNVAFFPMHLSGLLGMPRRVYTYPAGMGLETYNLISTIGAFVFATGVLLTVVNFLVSLRRGARAGDNPWNADSLEWSVSSPPPNAQYARLPVVRDRHPLWDPQWRQERMRPEDMPARDGEAEDDVMQMDHWPTRWRGALVVSVTDARPLAVVHMPRRSVAPFIMSVGFVTLFAALIVDNVPVMLAGLGIIALALVGWFWPQQTETAAMEEVGRPGADALPLAQAGPMSNGFWGTGILVLVLATALTTVVAGYFYLGGNVVPDLGNSPARHLMRPALATALLLAGAVPVVLAIRGIARGRRTVLRAGLLSALALCGAQLWLLLDTWLGSGLAPATDGRHSAFLGVAGFQGIVSVILLVMLAVAVLWALARPGDARGHATAWNAGLVYGFAVLSGLVSFAALYLAPRLG
ncbi:MAG TPA: cytochrome c oxidase subunit I [Gemmatimonadales bacterium]|nr:cytochrome c oxidase subunit I [Gemmatimonadales bacterium]